MTVESDACLAAITSVCRAMKIDFASQFNKSFSSDAEKRDLWERMKQKLSSKSPQCIVDGYDLAASKSSPHMPTVIDIVAGAEEAEKTERRKQNEAYDAQRSAKLRLKHEDSYHSSGQYALEALASAKSRKNDDPGETLEQRRKRVGEMYAENEKRIAEYRRAGTVMALRHLPSNPRCACGCGLLGTISHSTNGSESWYSAGCFNR